MAENQRDIIAALHVRADRAPDVEIRERIAFLQAYLAKTNATGYVVGISGGVDSTLTGLLARLACDERSAETGKPHRFVAVRLPYGTQLDEEDAQRALAFIRPHMQLAVNIKPAIDAALAQFVQAVGEPLSDFHKGNTKARERMKVQYDIAAHFGLLVLSTDQAPEAATGFFTKYGDGGADVAPLSGLTKGQVRSMLAALGAPEALYRKTPTADLEDERPQLPDEAALGFTYDQLDRYLAGETVPADVQEKIERHYARTMHKRQLAVTPFDTWWR